MLIANPFAVNEKSQRQQAGKREWLIAKPAAALVLMCMLCLFSSAVFAIQDSPYRAYYGVGLGPISGNDARFNGMDFQAGYEMLPWMNLEGHIGFSNSDTVTVGSTPVDLNINYYNSIRLRFNMLARDYRAYAFLGFTTISISEKYPSVSYTKKRAGYSYGLGIDLFGNESTALYASIGKLIDNDIDDTDLSLTQFSVGFRYYLRANYVNPRIPGRLQF